MQIYERMHLIINGRIGWYHVLITGDERAVRKRCRGPPAVEGMGGAVTRKKKRERAGGVEGMCRAHASIALLKW
jgi:hypothetical protein